MMYDRGKGVLLRQQFRAQFRRFVPVATHFGPLLKEIHTQINYFSRSRYSNQLRNHNQSQLIGLLNCISNHSCLFGCLDSKYLTVSTYSIFYKTVLDHAVYFTRSSAN